MVLESTLLMRTFLRNELLANRWIPKDSCCSRNRILAQLRCRVAFKWRLELADDRLAQSWYPLPWTDPSTIGPAHLRIQFLTDMQWWEWRYTRMLMSWKYFIVICFARAGTEDNGYGVPRCRGWSLCFPFILALNHTVSYRAQCGILWSVQVLLVDVANSFSKRWLYRTAITTEQLEFHTAYSQGSPKGRKLETRPMFGY